MQKILLLVFEHRDLIQEAKRLKYVCKIVDSPKILTLPSLIDAYQPNLIVIDDTCPRIFLEMIHSILPRPKITKPIICKVGNDSEEFPDIESITFLRQTEDLLN